MNLLERLKSERVQFWARIFRPARTFADKVKAAIDWFKAVCEALKGIFGARTHDDDS